MGLLLLLLLGGLAAGAGVWAATGGKKEDAGGPPSGYTPPAVGPKPPAGSPGPGVPPPGEPVVHGDKLRDMLRASPESVQARVDEAEKKKSGKKEKKTKSGTPELTYKTDQIVPPESQYAFQRRPLKNAEALVEKGKAGEARSLYEKIKNRIPDSDIKAKIEQNIRDITEWLEGESEEERDETGGMRYPELISPQYHAMESLADGLKAVAEELGGKMAEALMNLQGKAVEKPAVPGVPEDILGEISSLKFKKDLEKPEGYGVNEEGKVTTDGWTDEDFEKEWEKYKDLPLKDRRSESRRAGEDRRGGDGDLRKDRRHDADRRQEDLFDERDRFLEKLEQHKKNKMLHDLEKKREEELAKAPKTKLDLAAEISEPPIIISGRESLREAAMEGMEPVFEKKREGEKPSPVQQQEKETAPERKAEEASPEPVREELPVLNEKETPKPELRSQPEAEAPEEKVEEAVPEKMPGEERAPAPTGEAMPSEIPAPAEAAPSEAAERLPAAAPIPREGLGEGVEGASEIPDLEEEGFEEGEEPAEPEKPAPIQEIRGVLELKPPEEDDAPFLTLTYDFSKIPDSFKLSRDYHTMEYVYYKYKPMLVKAQEFTRRKMLKNALNYYRVIKSQRIPPEFKRMINRNIQDITEYLEKFLMRRSG